MQTPRSLLKGKGIHSIASSNPRKRREDALQSSLVHMKCVSGRAEMWFNVLVFMVRSQGGLMKLKDR